MKNREKVLWLIGMFILLAGCLQSCVTQRKVEKFLSNNEEFASSWCGTKYPVKEVFVKGKDSVIHKTIEIKGDSIPCPPNEKGEVVKVKCPDQKIVYQNVYRTDTVVKENTANLKSLEIRLRESDKELSMEKEARLEAEKRAKNRLWWLIGICGVFGIGVLLKFKGLLPF